MPSFLTPDFGLIFWLVLAFSVMFFVLAKFAFPAIVGMVEERKKFIDESLIKAREANEKLAQIQEESEQLLKATREEQALILKGAMATRDSIVAEAKKKADEEGKRQLQEAKEQIAAEKEKALRDIREEVAQLSVQIAEQLLRRQLSDENKQNELIDKILDELVVNK